MHKKVPIYAYTAAGERCHVYLLDKYLSKLLSAAKEKGWFAVSLLILSHLGLLLLHVEDICLQELFLRCFMRLELVQLE